MIASSELNIFIPISSDRTCRLVKDYVFSLSMPDRHTARSQWNGIICAATKRAVRRQAFV
jgi:hypothetical protein